MFLSAHIQGKDFKAVNFINYLKKIVACQKTNS
jgi:hypothetical protein